LVGPIVWEERFNFNALNNQEDLPVLTRFLLGAVSSGTLFLAAPATGVTQSNQGSSVVSAGALALSLPSSASVTTFYNARANRPIWLQTPGAPEALISTLRRASLDGFAKGPQLAAAAEAALAAAKAGNPLAQGDADRLLSGAWVLYVQALHWPTAGMIYADPALAPTIPAPDAILAQAATTSSLADHVRRVSSVNPLYAELREAAWNQSRLGTGEVPPALLANLERARALPASGRFVMVDLATQQLFMMNGGTVEGTMKVVVGKTDMKTPLMAGRIHQVTFNPYWNVPVDLVRDRVAPAVVKQGVSYLSAKHYEVLSDWTENATVVDPGTVDWPAVAEGRTELRVRQLPGDGNMMGQLKYEFPNTKGIYLHDTPERSLFASAQRTFSSGCVRLEDARRLGRWLIGAEPVAPSAAPETQLALKAPVPVFLTYLTVKPGSAGLAYATDVYGLDQAATTTTQVAAR
jgi:murein L,D-transpeptidase YcbB/YkuD